MTLATLSGQVRADTPVATAGLDPVPTSIVAEAPAVPAVAPAVAVAPQDRLLEIVVEYLEVAFAHEPGDARTASLQPASPATVLQ